MQRIQRLFISTVLIFTIFACAKKTSTHSQLLNEKTISPFTPVSLDGTNSKDCGSIQLTENEAKSIGANGQTLFWHKVNDFQIELGTSIAKSALCAAYAPSDLLKLYGLKITGGSVDNGDILYGFDPKNPKQKLLNKNDLIALGATKHVSASLIPNFTFAGLQLTKTRYFGFNDLDTLRGLVHEEIQQAHSNYDYHYTNYEIRLQIIDQLGANSLVASQPIPIAFNLTLTNIWSKNSAKRTIVLSQNSEYLAANTFINNLKISINKSTFGTLSLKNQGIIAELFALDLNLFARTRANRATVNIFYQKQSNNSFTLPSHLIIPISQSDYSIKSILSREMYRDAAEASGLAQK